MSPGSTIGDAVPCTTGHLGVAPALADERLRVGRALAVAALDLGVVDVETLRRDCRHPAPGSDGAARGDGLFTCEENTERSTRGDEREPSSLAAEAIDANDVSA